MLHYYKKSEFRLQLSKVDKVISWVSVQDSLDLEVCLPESIYELKN